MKIVVLDGYTENPGDLSWEGLERLGDRFPEWIRFLLQRMRD